MSGGESKKDGCHEPDFAVSSAGRAKSFSDLGSLLRVHDRWIYSERNVSIVVIEISSSSTGQKDLTTKFSDCAHTCFSKYVNSYIEKTKNEAKGCVVVGSLQPFCGHAMDERVRRGVEGASGRQYSQSRTEKCGTISLPNSVLWR